MLLHRVIKREEEDGKVVVLRHRGFRSSHLHKNMDSSSVQFSSVVVIVVVVVEESPIHAWSNSKKKNCRMLKKKKNIYILNPATFYIYIKECARGRREQPETYIVLHMRLHTGALISFIKYIKKMSRVK